MTTKAAAGGALEAERIARLCWAKFEAGAKKDAVLEYRGKLYVAGGNSAIPRKRGALTKGKQAPLTQELKALFAKKNLTKGKQERGVAADTAGGDVQWGGTSAA